MRPVSTESTLLLFLLIQNFLGIKKMKNETKLDRLKSSSVRYDYRNVQSTPRLVSYKMRKIALKTNGLLVFLFH